MPVPQTVSPSPPRSVLHAVLGSAAGIRLWMETADPAAPPAGGRPRRHPFAAEEPDLRRAIACLAPDLEDAARRARVRDVTLLLPGRASAPTGSPELGQPARPGRGQPALRAWTAPALELPPAEALDLLLGLPAAGDPAGHPGPAVGASLRFGGEVAAMALDLVAGGRLLPALDRDDGRFVARWRPVAAADDRARLRLLASAMPASARAEAPGGAPGLAAGTLLDRLLALLTDAAARAALAARPRRVKRGRTPAAEAWLDALAAPDPVVSGDAIELGSLERRLRAWQAEADGPDQAVRLCFRLTPPPEARPDDPWRVELLLQARDDPSLQVAAADVWRSGPELAALQADVRRPQERLLAELGRASRLWPELVGALSAARPVEVVLDAAGAHRFLRESATLLAHSGFGVLVPPWWHEPQARLGLRLRAAPARTPGTGPGELPPAQPGRLGLEGLVDYRWEVAIGDQALTPAELRELARLKVPLVQVRGRWVELRPEELDGALALLERERREGRLPATAVLRAAAGLDAGPADLPVVATEAGGWLADLLAGDAGRRLEPAPAPPGFHGVLRPYQERGLAWLRFMDAAGMGAILADDMGLGKTIQVLALLLAERDAGERADPTLLVCPMSLAGNWQREAARFAPDLSVHVHHGADRLAGDALADEVAGYDLVVTTYGTAVRDREALAGVRWAGIVLDEAQHVKNSVSQQARAVRAIPAPRRLALTGTPIENRLGDLWSIMDFLNPGLLGTASDFRRRFAVPVERYRDESAAALLKRVSGPFVLRRLKTDRAIIADLPEKVEMRVFCNITREQATLYQAVLDDMLARIDAAGEDIERRGLVLATMLKLKQVLNHPAQLLRDGSRLADRSGKLARLEDVLEEVLAAGERALVFTQFSEMGALLQTHLREHLGRDALFLHGGTPKRARDEQVAWFQSGAGPPVFVLSLKAGGTGLNLTAANHVVHYDRWWNPAVEDQATDRAFRIGQRRDVQVRKLVCVGTLEERIDRLIEDKRELAGRIVGAGEAWLTELSTAELRELVALSADAVGDP